MRDRILMLFVIALVSSGGYAQQVKPMGKFLSDSVRIGEEILYSLSVTYPRDFDVLFPDSLYNFSPFELNQKDYFFTRSDSTSSFDSAVYNLSTFEIDTLQFLALPIWMVRNGDSVAYFAKPDTVILNQVVTQIPDSLAFIDNTIYKEVNYAFNYPYFLIGAGVVILIIIFVTYFFGSSIQRTYRLYRLRRAHENFVKTYSHLIQSKNHNWEKSLLEWKKYMEKLDEAPYTKLTTREIVKKTKNNLLMKALKGIDRAIYGNFEKDTSQKYFEELVSFARNVYANKVKKIKYGAGS